MFNFNNSYLYIQQKNCFRNSIKFILNQKQSVKSKFCNFAFCTSLACVELFILRFRRCGRWTRRFGGCSLRWDRQGQEFLRRNIDCLPGVIASFWNQLLLNLFFQLCKNYLLVIFAKIINKILFFEKVF